MTGAQYIVDSLIQRGVTDTFGIPGGVILRLIYEMDNRRNEIVPHLSYHEQSAGFAACGYAQSTNRLGVAYATRGPGFTNLISAIADSYYDSLPVLFITAHTTNCPPAGMRIMADQEMDTCAMVRNITKAAVRVDSVDSLVEVFENLCDLALSGRKGPVFMDVATKILNEEVPLEYRKQVVMEQNRTDVLTVVKDIVSSLRQAKRPVLLIGDGVNQSGANDLLRSFVEKAGIPVISSRFSHAIMGDSEQYYGYVGSHGNRCANFILSKTDLILSLGNRLHFPVESQTFGEIFSHARLIRCEIDENEFQREIPNSTNYHIDIAELLSVLINEQNFGKHNEWMAVCNILKQELQNIDMNEAVLSIRTILSSLPPEWSVVNDVGNNEFWVSQAGVSAQNSNRTYYSKSLGALGCALGKSIGVYYATRKPVVCFVGDQGLQMNIQELQYIAQHKLPICIVLINNHVSGMIKDREKSLGKYVHTTKDSGFESPSYKGIAEAYGISYQIYDTSLITNNFLRKITFPIFVELIVNEDISLAPNLPRGTACQDMQPMLQRSQYDYLNQL